MRTRIPTPATEAVLLLVDGHRSVRAMAAQLHITGGAVHQHLVRAQRAGWALPPEDKRLGRWRQTPEGKRALRLCARLSR